MIFLFSCSFAIKAAYSPDIDKFSKLLLYVPSGFVYAKASSPELNDFLFTGVGSFIFKVTSLISSNDVPFS